MSSHKVLFIAPLPPPTTGQSVASKALYDDLVSKGKIVKLVNLSKQSFSSGKSSFVRIIEICKILWYIYKYKKNTTLIYFTPSESLAGNVKDILIYITIYKYLPHTYIHMHGGAGMKKLLSNEHPIIKKINSFFLKKMAGVIVLGERLTTIYSNIVYEKNIHIVKNFSPEDVFIKFSSLQRKLKNTNTINILFLSNLLPGKGHDDLINAIKILPEHILKKINIDFAGGFESFEEEQFFIKQIEEIPCAKYHGIVGGEKKRNLLHNAHVFCLPTYYPYEGQPISILEAYAAGCTVLTTDHSGIFDIFEPDLNGLAIEKCAPDSIANAITKLVCQRELLHKFSVINMRTAKIKYRLKHHLKNVHAILLESNKENL